MRKFAQKKENFFWKDDVGVQLILKALQSRHVFPECLKLYRHVLYLLLIKLKGCELRGKARLELWLEIPIPLTDYRLLLSPVLRIPCVWNLDYMEPKIRVKANFNKEWISVVLNGIKFIRNENILFHNCSCDWLHRSAQKFFQLHGIFLLIICLKGSKIQK